MSELSLTIIKLGFLAVLWLFVLSAISVIRTDLFGARVPRQAGPPAARKPKPVKQPKSRVKKGEPSRAVVIEGASVGAAAALGDAPLTIGRGQDCELRVDDEYVSTKHAVLRRENGSWYVEDLGSTNGTFVDGSRIHGPTRVDRGAPFRVGKTIVELTK